MFKRNRILGAAGRSLKVFLAAGVLGIFLSGTAFAASGEDAYRMAEGTENYADVYDMADLFTDEEEQQLSRQAQTLSEKMKMEAVIVTTEENSDAFLRSSMSANAARGKSGRIGSKKPLL